MLAANEVRLESFTAGAHAVPVKATHLPTGVAVEAKPGEQRHALLKRLEAKVLAYAEELVERHFEQHGAEIVARATDTDMTPDEIRTELVRKN